MSLDRLRELFARLHALARRRERRARPADDAPVQPGARLDWATARALFESQLTARHLDRQAHELRERGRGYYTITSAGHEANVVLGRLLAVTDLCFLHYRSAALFVERARASQVDAVTSVLLGLTASSEEPIAGGRHKVFGSVPLGIPPQTSTVASHLPKALGAALGVERGHRLGLSPRFGPLSLPRDAIVMCSFGDASINHASATTALNAARWMAFQKLPLPLLFVCEDNGLGISVRTPKGWVRQALEDPLMPYFHADGIDLPASYDAAARAIETCRSQRTPVVLHLSCVRLLGHSGADPHTTYRTRRELDDDAERDPLWSTADALLRGGALDGTELVELDRRLAARVDEAREHAVTRPKLVSAEEVMRPICRHDPVRVHHEAQREDYHSAREAMFAQRLPEREKPAPMARLINWALHDLHAKYPEAMLFGEDVAEKGGVYNITAGLWKRAGAGRVFNTLLDETMILGLAQGLGLVGLLPVPEVQYLAFVHNAEDQLRGEAATTGFFSRGQLAAPMVLRIGSLGYQRGFGGHFHNDNSLAALRDIPGLILATPSNGHDAVGMLRTCFAAARIDGRIAVFLEPIALYHRRDLFEEGDGQLTHRFPPPGEAITLGEPAIYDQEARDLTIVTYANGVPMARRAARELSRHDHLRARIVDLRWLAPLPTDVVVEHALATGRLLIVDECRRTGNVGETLAASVARDDRCRTVRCRMVTSAESFVPLAEAAELVLPSEDDILAAARELTRAP